MIKKATNRPEKVAAISDDRTTFIRELAVELTLTMAAVNGKVNPDLPQIVVTAATALADKLKL